ncbi:MAG: Ig-like domain-containing protein, partial [Verrucomicrobiota bacterium]
GAGAEIEDAEALVGMYSVEPLVLGRRQISSACQTLLEDLVPTGTISPSERDQLILSIGRNFVNDPYLPVWTEERFLTACRQTLSMLDELDDDSAARLLPDEVSYWLHQWSPTLTGTYGWDQVFTGNNSFRGLAEYADALGPDGAWIVHSFKEIRDKAGFEVFVNGDDDMEPMYELMTNVIATYEATHGPVPYPFNPPVADAGPDRSLPPAALLDGSGSSDPDGEIVSWVWELDGAVVGRGEQVLRFVLPLGTNAIQLRVTDNYGVQATDLMTVDVASVLNIPPEGDDLEVALPEDGMVTLTLTGLDPDGSNLTFAIQSLPGNGSLTGAPPHVTYTADPGFIGTDTFTFVCNDGLTDSAPATVTIEVLSDAGHPPGLWYALQQVDLQGPNPNTRVSLDLSEIDSGWREHVEIFNGYFYDADGHVSFTEHLHGSDQRIYIDGELVLYDTVWNQRTWTDDLELTPGLHRIEIRITNHGGVEGLPGLGYDPNGGTNWIALADPGDGSVLRHAIAEMGSNTPPVAPGASYTTGGRNLNFEVPGSDANLDGFFHTILSPPAVGAVCCEREGGFDATRRYLAVPGYVGIETVSYVVDDEQAQSSPASVKIAV